MRIIIDTNLERIIVPDTFFNQIDKINQLLKARGGKEVSYEDYVKEAIEKAQAKPIVRKADLPSIKK